MFVASCLLLATSTLAAEFPPQVYLSAPPSKFNDNVRLQPTINPHSSFFYNFEQTRRDQPPQIEHREEEVGKYMGRREHLTTTTTTTTSTTPSPAMPSLNSFAGAPQPYRLPLTNAPVDSYAHQPYMRTSTIPPPPTPKWVDFSQDFFRPSPKLNTHSDFYPINHNQQPIVSTPAPVVQWSDPASWQPMPQHVPVSAPIVVVQEPAPPPSHQEQHGSQPNRGHRKFNWNDLKNAGPLTTPPPPASNPNANVGGQPRTPPPPVPTLSSWYGDNFGK